MKQGIEWQVTSLEVSQKLEELGVKQESLFYWKQGALHYWQKLDAKDLAAPSCSSAFTVAELGEILPGDVYTFKDGVGWTGMDFEDSALDKEGKSIMYGDIQANTEADARAKMLVYLLENKLLA